ncbi:hypothetical protein DLAC_01058 [Tieghemostelium lacteum]|uniref:Uncharacterized protein n=1 Tax=Tieghemostelium lacteum TaxID=361077 RepID=A0A152A7R4_TIELA|nr:hypothetical protein DLAC_01058 [Tieghemostelium lacteum]|eukprot:KYR02234.1 hypothetical protein DLAC_01058 [Tieghemostelium lacteum]
MVLGHGGGSGGAEESNEEEELYGGIPEGKFVGTIVDACNSSITSEFAVMIYDSLISTVNFGFDDFDQIVNSKFLVNGNQFQYNGGHLCAVFNFVENTDTLTLVFSKTPTESCPTQGACTTYTATLTHSDSLIEVGHESSSNVLLPVISLIIASLISLLF